MINGPEFGDLAGSLPETHFLVTYVGSVEGQETPMRSFATRGEAERHIERARAMDKHAGTQFFKYGIFEITRKRIQAPK